MVKEQDDNPDQWSRDIRAFMEEEKKCPHCSICRCACHTFIQPIEDTPAEDQGQAQEKEPAVVAEKAPCVICGEPHDHGHVVAPGQGMCHKCWVERGNEDRPDCEGCIHYIFTKHIHDHLEKGQQVVCKICDKTMVEIFTDYWQNPENHLENQGQAQEKKGEE
jgi:hypothetical protein